MSVIDDRVRLQHMLDASLKAISFVEGKSFDELKDDDLRVFALIKVIEIVGEAAGRVSKDYQNSNPQIPWTAIVSMRNRLVHAYFDINLQILWQTVQQDLPLLIEQLKKLLENYPNE